MTMKKLRVFVEAEPGVPSNRGGTYTLSLLKTVYGSKIHTTPVDSDGGSLCGCVAMNQAYDIIFPTHVDIDGDKAHYCTSCMQILYATHRITENHIRCAAAALQKNTTAQAEFDAELVEDRRYQEPVKGNTEDEDIFIVLTEVDDTADWEVNSLPTSLEEAEEQALQIMEEGGVQMCMVAKIVSATKTRMVRLSKGKDLYTRI